MASPSQLFLDSALRTFAKEFIKNRTADIIKADLVNQRALLNSLHAQVVTEPERGVFMMLVAFNTYGRIQDMARRRVDYRNAGGEEMIEYLESWIGKKGINAFMRGKYREKYAQLPDSRIKNQIAWGIIRKLRQKGKRKKRGWWNTGKERDINQFYDWLLRGYAETVQSELKQKMESA